MGGTCCASQKFQDLLIQQKDQQFTQQQSRTKNQQILPQMLSRNSSSLSLSHSSDYPNATFRQATQQQMAFFNRIAKATQLKYGTYKYPIVSINANNKLFSPQISQNGQLYVGQWRWGRQHGRGIQVWPDGSIYEGEWLQGKATGSGRLVHSSGDYYEGEFFENKCDGYGKFINLYSQQNDRNENLYTKYEGYWKNDRQQGTGIQIRADQSRYEGDFKNGMKDGHGVFEWKDGSKYCGEFKQNKIQGQGNVIWSDKSIYQGQWKNNLMHGSGTYIFSDGRTYVGEYINGLKEGKGTFSWSNNRKYEGYWKGGKQHGYGKYTNSRGIVKQGLWNEGKYEQKKLSTVQQNVYEGTQLQIQ